MKKFLLIAVAAVMALGFASCTKENTPGAGPREEKVFKISLPNVKANYATQALGAAATAGTVTSVLENGMVFVYDGDECVGKEMLNVAAATTGGQVLAVLAPLTGTVYVVGNIPGADDAARQAVFNSIAVSGPSTTGSTVADLMAVSADISTQQTDYLKVALMGSDPYDSATDTQVDGTVKVDVEIAPMVARLELSGVRGSASAAAGGQYLARLAVTGVYVDGWHSKFTFGGSYAGDPFVGNNLTANFVGGADLLSDEENTLAWAFAAGDSKVPAVADASAAPAEGVWGYQVAAGYTGAPRLVVGLTNIKITDGSSITGIGMAVGGTPKTALQLSNETFFVSVTGYTDAGNAVTSFEPGKVYQVEALSINPDNLGLTPNPDNVALRVNVTVKDWTIVPVKPVIG